MMDLQFLGAADSVTGSRHRVDLGDQRLLLDCGLFQGYKALRERNWAPPPQALLQVDAVVLSHAHLDHSGFLPALVRQGWRGPIYASPATCALAEVMLLDSAHLQEEDARRANRQGYSRHDKALPLYTRADAHRALSQFVPLPPGRPQALGNVTLQLHPVGHLLGACAVQLSHAEGRLVFSGDLGRPDDLLMPPPQPLPQADVLIVESTYGNRRHAAEDVMARLAAIVNTTVHRGGSVLMPTFAVGRAQALLLVLQRLKRSGAIPPGLPIFLDSPMAQRSTELYRRFGRLLRIKPAEAASLTDGVRIVETARQSQRLAGSRYPCVILSASGMATGGRVLTHLAAMAPEPRHHIVFPGFQVGGSRGAKLVSGAREIKLRGEFIPVRAEVSHVEGFSGHADGDGLIAWMKTAPAPPRQTFVVHGEPEASDALRSRIADELGWRVRVPQHGERVSA